jgi:hypothetical protein
MDFPDRNVVRQGTSSHLGDQLDEHGNHCTPFIDFPRAEQQNPTRCAGFPPSPIAKFYNSPTLADIRCAPCIVIPSGFPDRATPRHLCRHHASSMWVTTSLLQVTWIYLACQQRALLSAIAIEVNGPARAWRSDQSIIPLKACITAIQE